MAQAACEHGATSVYATVLFLISSAYAQFIPFLKHEFPQPVRRYKKHYARSSI